MIETLYPQTDTFPNPPKVKEQARNVASVRRSHPFRSHVSGFMLQVRGVSFLTMTC
jgi:hypothetical protein